MPELGSFDSIAGATPAALQLLPRDLGWVSRHKLFFL